MRKNLRYSRSKSSAERKPTILHLTTLHPISDVRIYQRECRSVAAYSDYFLLLAGPGELPPHPACTLVSLPSPFQNRILRFLQSQFIAIRIGLKYRPDLLHLHDPELLLFGLLMSRVFKQKVIWDAHEDYVAQILEGTKPWIPKNVQVFIANLLRWLLRQVDKYFAGIIGATDFICSLYANPNTILVGNEARISDFNDANPDLSSNQVLFTGAQNESSLFLEVVKAVAELKHVRLAVAGRRSNEGLWAEAEAILGERLIGLGYLSPQGLVEAISNSALGMVTYRFQEFQETSSPTKFFEFAAAGLPIVATPIAANASLVNQAGNGLLTDGFTSVDLAKAISSAFSDRSQLNRWSSSGRIWSHSNGNWSLSESRLLSAYSVLLKREGHTLN